MTTTYTASPRGAGTRRPHGRGGIATATLDRNAPAEPVEMNT
ncbi:hypothetical protein ACTU45_04020 [Streptomyces sp. 24-1644]